MSWLSTIAKKAAPIVATFSPEPISKGIATAATVQYQRQEASYQRKLQEEKIRKEQEKMSEIFGSSRGLSSIQAPMVRPTTQNAGFGAGFGEFLGDVGRNIVSPFASLATAISPFFPSRSIAQQPAVTTTRSVGGQESQGSGSMQAGLGTLVPSLVSGARGLLKSPLGQLSLGGGTALALQGFDRPATGMRITRKMKSQARMVLNMVGGDLSLASNMLGIDEQTLVMVLLKRFRNDGPVVTKAALRKTKQTVRRLKSMCDMYDSLRPTATRRRSPIKRASTTTLIKN